MQFFKIARNISKIMVNIGIEKRKNKPVIIPSINTILVKQPAPPI